MGLQMHESCGIDSDLRGRGMSRPYSDDLRLRGIDAVEAGASRREVAELLEVSPSTIVNWLRRWCEDRIARAMPSGGSVSPLEAHAEWLLGLVAKQPDLTLDEIVAAMAKRKIAGSRSAVSRFYIRHGITFKKKFACHGATSRGRSPRAPALEPRARHA
jgi:transposase